MAKCKILVIVTFSYSCRAEFEVKWDVEIEQQKGNKVTVKHAKLKEESNIQIQA